MYTEENMITTVETIIQLQDLSDKQELLDTFLNYFNFDRLAANIRNQARIVHCFEKTTPKSGLTFHPGWTLFPCRAALLLTTGHIASGNEIIAAHHLELWLLEDMRLNIVSNYALAKKCADGLHLSENRRLIGEHTIPGEFPIAPTDLITQLFALSVSSEPKTHFLQRI